MRSFAEFIVEANDIQLWEDAGDRLADLPDEEFKRYIKSQPSTAAFAEKKRREAQARRAAQSTSQTRSSRTSSTSSTTNSAPGSRRQAAKDFVKNKFRNAVDAGRDLKQKAGEKVSKATQGVRDAASKAADTTPRQAAQSAKNVASKATQGVRDAAKNAPNDVATKLKYGRKIRPNSSTSALATRSSELAKAANTTSKFAKGLRIAGRVAGPAAAALDVASERSKGSGWLRSLAKGAVTAAGGAAGGAAGSVVGPVGTVAGGIGGAAAASKAFDVAAGKNAVERAADRVKNRQRQSGGALVGTGGKTTFNTKKNTMTTGNKTVNLAKTSAVTDPKSGKKETGFLAYKGGKAVYKRAAAPGTGSSNAFERIGRAINPNAYKANDAKLAAQKLNQAKANDAARNAALGVKPKK
jgi:hypothetical protein